MHDTQKQPAKLADPAASGTSNRTENVPTYHSTRSWSCPSDAGTQTSGYHSVSDAILHGIEDYAQQLQAAPTHGNNQSANSSTSVEECVQMSECVWQGQEEKGLIEDIYRNLNYSLDEFLSDSAILGDTASGRNGLTNSNQNNQVSAKQAGNEGAQSASLTICNLPHSGAAQPPASMVRTGSLQLGTEKPSACSQFSLPSQATSGTDLFKRRMSVTFLDQNQGSTNQKKQPVIPLLDPSNFAIPYTSGDSKKSAQSFNQIPTPLNHPEQASSEHVEMMDLSTQNQQSQMADFDTGFEECEMPLEDLVSSFPRRSVVFRNAIYPLCDEALEHIMESEQMKRTNEFEFPIPTSSSSSSVTSLVSTPTISAFGEFPMLTSDEHSLGNTLSSYHPIVDGAGREKGFAISRNGMYFESDSGAIRNDNSNGVYSVVPTNDALPNLCNVMSSGNGMQRMPYHPMPTAQPQSTQLATMSTSSASYSGLATPVTPSSNAATEPGTTKNGQSKLLMKKTKVCYSCKTSITPLWRKDPLGNILCNACGLYYKIHGKHKTIDPKAMTNGSGQMQPVRRKKLDAFGWPTSSSPTGMLALGMDGSSSNATSSGSFLRDSPELLSKFERYCHARTRDELQLLDTFLAKRLELVHKTLNARSHLGVNSVPEHLAGNPNNSSFPLVASNTNLVLEEAKCSYYNLQQP